MLNIPAGSTGRIVKAKPAAVVAPKVAKPAAAKQESAPRVKRERTRTKRISS
jgi:hypothetical protein